MAKSANQKWHDNNRERVRERKRLWYAKNKASSRASNKKWRAANPEYSGKWDAKWRKTNPETYLYRRAKSRAKQNGLAFNIEPSDVVIPMFCPLLGFPLVLNTGGASAAPNSPSIDRKDPSKGYVKGNIWVISHQANAMKNGATAEELRTFALRVLDLF